MATVAILGTRYRDVSVEEEILAPLGARIVVGSGADHDAIMGTAGDADVILAGSRPRFDARTIDALACTAIVRYGVGVDSIDLDAARRRGLWVVSVPDYGTDAVAVHTVTLVLAALRRLTEADRSLRGGEWGFGHLRPLHLPASLTAGVVGFGRIGRRVAALLRGLGFGRIVAHDAFSAVDEPGVEPIEFATLLGESDVVTLHVPGDPSAPLLDAGAIGMLKPGSVLVNTARGSLIDAGALAAGLAAGRPAVAALDVFSPEPAQLDVFEAVADRMILTPHMAWYTEETERDLRVKTAQEAGRILTGAEPLHPVVRPHLASAKEES